MASPALSIQLHSLVKKFQVNTILKGITFTAEAGQTVCIIGPSGGGKSTVLRCINGLNTFDSGTITIGDQRLLPNASGEILNQVRRQVGMIFQDFRLFGHLSVFENIIEAPMRLKRASRADATSHAHYLLERVGLKDRAHHMPHQLSGGQQQRVAIARALAMKPRALLCDEVTSALDPERKQDVLSVLKELRNEGMTIIMVTHEMGFARRAADKVVVLADGLVAEEGSPEEIFTAAKSERTRQFLSKVLE